MNEDLRMFPNKLGLKEYVVVHARRIDVDGAYDDVLVVHKDRPAWQAGRLNLVGGKIEEGEDPFDAAVRELKEEAGLVPLQNQPVVLCGHIISSRSYIYCVRIDVDHYDSRSLSPREGETEAVEWMSFKDAWADDRLMPNLRISVPLMHLGVTGWAINDRNSSTDAHDVEVILPLGKPFGNQT